MYYKNGSTRVVKITQLSTQYRLIYLQNY